MPVVRTYSLLHQEPSSPGTMLNRYLGTGTLVHRCLSADDSPKQAKIQSIDSYDTRSLTTTEFFADMKVDHSEIDSIYEECGALIDEGFVLQHEDEDVEELEQLDWAVAAHDLPPLSSSPPGTPQMLPRGSSDDTETVPPTPPYLLSTRGGPPPSEPSRPSHIAFNGFPGYVHLDPTRPNPYIRYLCEWNGACLRRLRGSSPGYIQYHLRQEHLIPDNTDNLVRCLYLVHGKYRICGEEVPAKELGIHVCDVHWKSRMVRCPFCGHWQVSREKDVMQAHWTLCPKYKSASEENRKNWVKYWKWPAKRWSGDI
ncbi:hypothetical protein M378DRAFT_397631 [Amanita muscaria Koide BX008]|uniref:Uncharacterized protein n=1 Tax=Amanita muscaria (strain Koide BX008) TaxID=946122 RepID=A0A0C2W7Y5_AMAMK|nr:hypothetical protein M378DRAFT_397631 [Amanita muscaria Koide BX008]